MKFQVGRSFNVSFDGFRTRRVKAGDIIDLSDKQVFRGLIRDGFIIPLDEEEQQEKMDVNYSNKMLGQRKKVKGKK